MIKRDGCVAVHADTGAYKPLNWMTSPNTLVVESDKWVVTNPKGEALTITIEEVLHDITEDLPDAPGLEKDGVEAHLQVLLADQTAAIEEGLVLIRREHQTDIGPVDLLCKDKSGRTVAVEIKRRGEIDGVEQLTRYVERLSLDGRLGEVRGLLVAQQIKPQAKVLARSRGLGCVEVNYDVLRGAAEPDLTLW